MELTQQLQQLLDRVAIEDQIKHDLKSGAYWSSIIDGTTMEKWAELTPIIFPEVS